MIRTEKETGFYTDVFGNEITEYEMIPKYTIYYKGILFEGDTEGLNTIHTDHWEEAISYYYTYGEMIQIKDNEYDLIFANGDWS